MPFHTNHNIRLAAASLLALLLSSYLFANNGHAEELREISKVNGGIRIAASEQVGEVSSVTNGGIRIGSGSNVGGSVETVNGKISLNNTHVGDSVITTNGDILIAKGSVVEGDVIFEGRRRSWTRWFNWTNKPPELVIDSDAEVKGDIRLYHKVTLKIAEGAQVGDIKRHYRD
jgi:hypothetical protein